MEATAYTLIVSGIKTAENASATHNLTTEMHLEFDFIHLASILNDGIVFPTTLHSQWKI